MTKEEIIKKFKLRTTVTLQNCYLFTDEHKYPIKFNTVEEILKEYCKKGIQIYGEYKKRILSNLEREIELKKFKRLFIKLVIDEIIIFKN